MLMHTREGTTIGDTAGKGNARLGREEFKQVNLVTL